jgi:DNA-binding response OmpR family regulator
MAKVLLVADAEWVINDVRAALSDPAHDLFTVTDPREAEDVWYDEEPDVVVIDLQIGSMGGFAVTRALRGAASGLDESPPPMIALLDRSVDTFLASRSGADAWLLKPISAFGLRDLVTKLAANRAAEASS